MSEETLGTGGKGTVTRIRSNTLTVTPGTGRGEVQIEGSSSGGVVNAVDAGTGIAVDSSDPTQPVVSLTDGGTTNAKLADMATKTYKGRTSALTGVPEDVPVATLVSDLALTEADVANLVTDLAGKLPNATLNDTVFGPGWDGDTTHAPTKNVVYDKLSSLTEADIAGLVADLAGKLDTTALLDTAFGPSWDGDTTHAASRNALYDEITILSSALNAGNLGYVVLNDPAYGGVGDQRDVADGVVATGSTTLTSATAAFDNTRDSGKVVNLTQTRVVSDAAIATTGTGKTLTSATAVFSAADVGKTVHIDGAGAAGVALLTTIASFTSSTSVEVTAAASTTVTNKVLEIRAVHNTTIASVSNSTTAILTAAPTFGFVSGASVVWGTDNRVALAAAIAAAVTAQKPVWVSPLATGYMIVTSAANPNAMAAATDDFSVYGGGKKLTRIVMVSSDLITSSTRLMFNVGVNNVATVVADIRDMTVDYIGIAGATDAQGPDLIACNPTGQGCEMVLTNVSSTGFAHGPDIHASAGNNVRHITTTNCEIITRYVGCYLFTDTGAGTSYDAVLRIYNTRFENTSTVTTQTNDTQFNNHNIYIHPSVSMDIDGLVLKSATLQTGQFGIHYNGSPTEPIKFCNIRRLRTDYTSTAPGKGHGILLNPSVAAATGVLPVLEDCQFVYIGGGITEGACSYETRGNFYRCTATAISPSTASATAAIEKKHYGGRFLTDAMTSAVGVLNTGHVSSLTEFYGTEFVFANNANAIYGIGQTANDHNLYLFGVRFIGLTGNSTPSCGLQRKRVLCSGCRWVGEFSAGCVVQLNTPADDAADFYFVDCDASEVTVGDFTHANAAWGNGNIRGANNAFNPTNANAVLNGATGSGAFVPPARKNATALASTSALAPDWNHDSFDVSGTTTIDNIEVGGSLNRNRMRGGNLYLHFTGAVPLKHNSGGTGNIRLIGGVDKTMIAGQDMAFRIDEKTGIWYEIGGEAGARTTFTQTYSTADPTVAAQTAAAVATTAATLTTPYGYTTQAQADDIVTELNALRLDHLDTTQALNSVIDALQALGISL